MRVRVRVRARVRGRVGHSARTLIPTGTKMPEQPTKQTQNNFPRIVIIKGDLVFEKIANNTAVVLLHVGEYGTNRTTATAV